ncbi:MAG: radical SAM superfamily enzyme YgiQ (UPF0313 family) [Gammaproteobacteria bacterium]|jgi:radical SAM superfamily enzyme YgiQ (UPF0313 family)
MFQEFPASYINPVFRPPSEDRSLILQVTNGCSWNRCTYCDMYTDSQKKFRPRSEHDILEEIRRCAVTGQNPRRIFLADGDALVLSMRRLRNILNSIADNFPDLNRVSSYCLPSDLKNKSDGDLSELRELGLNLIYVGAESGYDPLLKLIDKGETQASTIESLIRAKAVGIKTSVMILNGLGGRQFSEDHALASADLVNAAQPDYLAMLVLTFYRGADRFIQPFNGSYQSMNLPELCAEMKLFFTATDIKQTIFRSDHVSNHLVLKGVLSRDKSRILNKVGQAIAYFKEHPEVQRLVTGR